MGECIERIAGVEVATRSRIIAAHIAYGQVVEEIHELEPRLERLFERVAAAKIDLRDKGWADSTPLFAKPMNAAYAAWLAIGKAGSDASSDRAAAPADEHEARRLIGEPPSADAPPHVDGEGTLVLPQEPFNREEAEVGAWPLRGQ